MSSSLSQGCKTALVTEKHAFGADLASGRAKERQQFGRAAPLVLVRLQRGMAFGLPRGPWLRDGLIGPRFILVELQNALPPPPARTLARSVFFFRRLLVIGRHRAAFALAQRVARAAPGARR